VGQVLDALLGAVGAVDIHTGVGVSDRCGGGGVFGHGFLAARSLSASVWENAGFLAKQELPRPLIVTRSKQDTGRSEATVHDAGNLEYTISVSADAHARSSCSRPASER